MPNLLRQAAGLVVGVALTVAVLTVHSVYARTFVRDEAVPQPSAPKLVTLSADAAPFIHYQGQLFDPNSNALRANAVFAASFRLYPQAAGGNPLWFEDKNIGTNVDGVFNTQLGDTNGFGNVQNLFNGQELWLEIVLNGEVTTPRQPISYVPYAFYARNASTIDNMPRRDIAQIVAFGIVSEQGSHETGRNFSSTRDNIGEYAITMPGVNYNRADFTAIVTPSCNEPVFTGIAASQGVLLVDVWDTNGAQRLPLRVHRLLPVRLSGHDTSTRFTHHSPFPTSSAQPRLGLSPSRVPGAAARQRHRLRATLIRL
mgnify:CR=1 FL=1